MPLKNSARAEKILGAAAQLFAQQGYHATSTREIARLAEVSENTLFRHFEHKEDLFCSALRSYAAALRPRWDLLRELNTGESVGVTLPKILEQLAETAKCKPEIVRLIAVAFVELQGKAQAVCRDLISPLFSEIAQYLAVSVEKGEVVNVDPSLLAASLVSMALVQPEFSKLIGIEKKVGRESRNDVNLYSKFWLVVLSPRLPKSFAVTASTDG